MNKRKGRKKATKTTIVESERHLPPPPGRLVDVGGYRLHLWESDDGPHQCVNPTDESALFSNISPTVVLDAGRGDICLVWADVQPEVATFAPVCSYDRAGLGWSDRGDADKNPKTASRAAEELHTLLTNAGKKPPFVLVGHSLGGLFIRFYTQRYPEEVAGIVMVDPTPDGAEMKGVGWFFDQVVMLWAVRFMYLLSMCRILRLLSCCLRWPVPTPESERERYAKLAFGDKKHIGACIDEIKATPDILDESKEANINTFGDIPVIVLSSTPAPIPRGSCCSCMAPAVEAGNAKLAEMHTSLAELSPRGRRVVAKESRHHIQVDDPKLVIDAIKEVVMAVRASLEPPT